MDPTVHRRIYNAGIDYTTYIYKGIDKKGEYVHMIIGNNEDLSLLIIVKIAHDRQLPKTR